MRKMEHKRNDWIYFLFQVIFYTAVSMLWYRNLLFRCLPNMTYEKSRMCLWFLIILNVFISAFGYVRRGEFSITKMLIIPYGIYTVISYVNSYYQTWICTILWLIFIGCIVCSVLVMIQKIRKKKRSKIILRRIKKCLLLSHTIFAIGMTVLMIPIVFRLVVTGALIEVPSNSVEWNETQTSQPETMENNMEKLIYLKEDIWNTLSLEKKLEVIQLVVSIEKDFWGISSSKELHISVSNFSENVLGGYEHKSHTLLMDLSHLENSSSDKVLETVLHECCHWFQYNVAEVYLNSPKEVQNLKIYEEAKIYADEFRNYIGSSDSFEQYYKQKCETDARNYAKAAKELYYQKIDEYWNGDSNSLNSDDKEEVEIALWEIYLRDKK